MNSGTEKPAAQHPAGSHLESDSHLEQSATIPDRTLDTTGLLCPLPILKAKKALKELTPGQTLEVLATDPGAVEDFQVFCDVTGNPLLSHTVEGTTHRFVLRRT